MLLRLEALTLLAGTQELLIDAELQLNPGDRLGLIGRNGSGKTTLLRTLVGQREPDSGKVHKSGRVRIGYLPQDAVSGSEKTVWDEVRDGLGELLDLERRLGRAVEQLDGTPDSIERHAAAEEAFRIAGGYAADERVGTVLWGLGFGQDDWRRSCTEFSGGWQMRIALARLLVEQPEVLLLDEPTNHLDLHARAWLAGHLAELSGGLLLVSHDRYVLDRCVTGVVELRHRDLRRYNGDFATFLRERALRDAQLQATAERQAEEMARLQRFVDRFGAKATKASQANSRKKRLEKLAADAVEIQADEGPPRLRFGASEARSAEVLQLHGAAVGYDGPLLEGVDLDLRRGERWVFLGPNGSGKSTLLKGLSGQLPLLAGRRVLGRGVRIGVYAQDQAQDLPPEDTGVEVVLSRAPFITESGARSALGALGLSGEYALRPIKSLSGGEKARVALASLSVQRLDVLLLDEPTNHLDVVTVEVLTEALADFPGVIVIVSHDRRLVERLASHVVLFGGERLVVREGLLPQHLEPPEAHKLGGAGDTSTEAAESHKERQRRKREEERAKKELGEVEERVATLEERIVEIDEQMAAATGDVSRVEELIRVRVEVAEALDEAMQRWEALAEVVG
ncbi:MAG: ABC-F family ATP-binding cassette domain-containing protein [Alphaproteobacteria bacterium]|nr:ABC-F family ATP-binding cassette domain-containing protein [Alphaproteobacteria bacterium]MCB9795856.1 ABC-F family ATP-binding cassette domain-containing protein [Alphaproteobacteria bacterium]